MIILPNHYEGGLFARAPDLPSLPLPLGSRVVVHGDSMGAFNNFTGQTHTLNADLGAVNMASGPMEWALALDPRFDFDSWYDPADPWTRYGQGANQGIAGDHLGPWDGGPNHLPGNGILPRLDYTLAHNGQLVWLAAPGSNSLSKGDVTGASVGSSAAYVTAQLEGSLRRIRASGRWSVIETIRPRSDFDASQEANRKTVNAWIRAQAGRDGVAAIIDTDPLFYPGGVQNTSLYFLESGAYIHPNQKGAFLLGRDYYLPVLQALIASGSVFDTSPVNANLISASVAKFQGTGGALAGGTGTVVAGGYIKRRRGTSTFVASKENVTDATYQKQVLTITPVSDASAVHQFDIGLPFVTTGLPAAGTWIRAYVRVEVGNSEAIPLTILNLFANDSTTGTGHGTLADGGIGTDRCIARGGYGSFSSAAYGYLPQVANRSFWLMTKPLMIPVGATFDRLGMFVQTFLDQRTTDTAITVKLRDPIIRSVPDPRIAWGY